MKKRIFFVVEQLNLAGSAEYMAVMMASYLSEAYDVFLYSLESIDDNRVNPTFKVNSRIRINSLNIPLNDKENYIDQHKEEIINFFEHSVFDGDIFLVFTKFDMDLLPSNVKKIWVDGFEDMDDYQQFDHVIFLSKMALNKNKKLYPDLAERFILLNPRARLKLVEDFKFHGNHLFAIAKLENKNFADKMIDLVKKLKAQELKFLFTISCQGTYLNYFKEKITENDLNNCIELVPFGSLSKWFANADLFIYISSSKFMPMTIVESIVNSVPVICASENEYAKELLDNCGLILRENQDLAEVIISVLKDKIKLSKMKFETYESSHRFALNNPEALLINVITSLEK